MAEVHPAVERLREALAARDGFQGGKYPTQVDAELADAAEALLDALPGALDPAATRTRVINAWDQGYMAGRDAPETEPRDFRNNPYRRTERNRG